MEFPPAKYYGIRCAYCEVDYFIPAERQIKLQLMISSLINPPIPTPTGLIVGFGFENFNHNCKLTFLGE